MAKKSDKKQCTHIPSLDRETLIFALPKFYFGEDRESKIIFLLNDDKVTFRFVDPAEMTILNLAAGCKENGPILKYAEMMIEEVSDHKKRIQFVNHPDQGGYTPLYTAIIHFNDEFAAMLVRRGAVFSYTISSSLSLAKENDSQSSALKVTALAHTEAHKAEDLDTLHGSLLFEAFNNKMFKTVKELSRRGAVLTLAEQDYLNVKFEVAMKDKNYTMMRILYWTGVGRIVHVSERCISLLMYAFESKNAALFIGLVEDGVQWTQKEKMMTVENEAIVFAAIKRGNMEIVKAVVKAGADVDAKEVSSGKSALLLATEQGNVAVLNALLEAGACINAIQNEAHKRTVLHEAAMLGNLMIVKRLVNAGMNVNRRDEGPYERTALHYAALKGHSEMANFLIRSGAELNMKEGGEDKRTALHIAAEIGNGQIIEALIAGGADLNMKSAGKYKKTALHYAALSGNLEMATRLIQTGANINSKEDEGDNKSVLHMASEYGHLEMVRLLIREGVDLDSRDGYGRTALHYASGKGFLECAKILKNANANLETKDTHWQTPLHFAAQNGHLNVVSWLVKNRADTNVTDDRNKTALDLAEMRGRNNIVRFLTRL